MHTQHNRVPARTSAFPNRNKFRRQRIAIACSTLAVAALAAKARADLYLTDGQAYSFGPLVTSENIYIANATTVSFNGDVTDSASFNSGVNGGGNNLVNVSGIFNNSGSVTVNGTGDILNVGNLNNSGTITINTGALNITNGGTGITDIQGGATYILRGGSFSVINNNVSTGALANLSSIEGDLEVTSGQTYSFGTINNSGSFHIGEATTATVNGDLNNSGTFGVGLGIYGGNNVFTITGTFNNYGTYSMGDSNLAITNDVLNIGALNNRGTLRVNGNETLNITGGGPGVTDVISGTSLLIGGNFNVINSGVSTSALANLASIEGDLEVTSGQTYSFGTINNSGSFHIGEATTATVNGDLNNSGTFGVGLGIYGGNNVFTITGTFNNYGTYSMGDSNLAITNDVLNIGALNNRGTLRVNGNETLNITGGGPGVTDVISGTSLLIGGNFNVINSGVSTSALANLASIEGDLEVTSGQTYSFGTINNSGSFHIGEATTATVNGDLNNSGTFGVGLGIYGGNNVFTITGTFNNYGTYSMGDSNLAITNDVLNIGALNNRGTLRVNGNETLNITGGGPGVTDVTSGTSLLIGGNFNVINSGVSTSALANLSSIEGDLEITSGQTYTFGPISNSGSFSIGEATTATINGNVTNTGNFTVGQGIYGGYNVVNVNGAFYNYGSYSMGNSNLAITNDVVNIAALFNYGTVGISADESLRVGELINDGTIYGSLNFSGNATNNGNITIGGTQNITSGSTFNNTGGTTSFTSDAGPTGGTLLLNITGGTVNFNSTEHLLGLNISSGAMLHVAATGSQHSIVFTPAITVDGTLDLTNNNLVVQTGGSTALAAVTNLVAQSFNNGAWSGPGITSSTAANDTAHLTALGVMLNTTDGIHPLYGSGAPLGLFDGANPAANDVLVTYTYYGDTNLKGYVDGSDYSRIDNAYLADQLNNNAYTGWFNGDFNYDGVINGSDYALIDNAYNRQATQLSTQVATSTAQISDATGTSAVPEPAMGAIILTATGLLRRLRKIC